MKGSETPNFPPGFTPTSSHNQQDGLHDHNYVQYVGSESSHKALGDLHKPVGVSLLERLEETIKVGLALGLNMEGCENSLATLIAKNGELMVDK
nr:reverse transcriptase domain, reverse transcriptase zinc-binding domain protein [Tanacetum cinerariifolium]